MVNTEGNIGLILVETDHVTRILRDRDFDPDTALVPTVGVNIFSVEIKEAAAEIKGAADRIKEAACSKKSRGKIFDIRELGGQLAPVWGDYIK